MKITLCGSIASYDKMVAVQAELQAAGHEVQLPPNKTLDGAGKPIPVAEYYRIRHSAGADETWVWQRKAEAVRLHFDKVDWCDVILVVNETKNNIENYVGGNTLMEMGVAFYLKKKIYLLNPIPAVSYQEEILGMQPIIINGDISKII